MTLLIVSLCALIITQQVYLILLREHTQSLILLVQQVIHCRHIIVFIIQQAFLGILLPETVLLLQQIQYLPVHWYRIHSNYYSLPESPVKPLIVLYRHLIKPPVFPNIADGVSPFGVGAEDAFKEVRTVLGDELRNLEVSLQYLLVELGGIWILEGQVPTDEGEHDDAATPDIHIRTEIPLAGNHLRSGIAWTATSSG